MHIDIDGEAEKIVTAGDLAALHFALIYKSAYYGHMQSRASMIIYNQCQIQCCNGAGLGLHRPVQNPTGNIGPMGLAALRIQRHIAKFRCCRV